MYQFLRQTDIVTRPYTIAGETDQNPLVQPSDRELVTEKYTSEDVSRRLESARKVLADYPDLQPFVADVSSLMPLESDKVFAKDMGILQFHIQRLRVFCHEKELEIAKLDYTKLEEQVDNDQLLTLRLQQEMGFERADYGLNNQAKNAVEYIRNSSDQNLTGDAVLSFMRLDERLIELYKKSFALPGKGQDREALEIAYTASNLRERLIGFSSIEDPTKIFTQLGIEIDRSDRYFWEEFKKDARENAITLHTDQYIDHQMAQALIDLRSGLTDERLTDFTGYDLEDIKRRFVIDLIRQQAQSKEDYDDLEFELSAALGDQKSLEELPEYLLGEVEDPGTFMVQDSDLHHLGVVEGHLLVLLDGPPEMMTLYPIDEDKTT